VSERLAQGPYTVTISDMHLAARVRTKAISNHVSHSNYQIAIGVNLGGLGLLDPRFYDGGCEGRGCSLNIIISSNVQEFQMRTLPKVVNFQK